MKKNVTKNYFLGLLASTLLLLSCVAVINFIVDPYGIYNFINANALNKNKPAINDQTRLHKAVKLQEKDYSSVILGSSRALRAINPELGVFDSENTYSLSFNGANIFELWQYLKFANRHNTIKEVLLTLDFQAKDEVGPPAPDFKAARFATGKSYYLQKIDDLKNSLLSQSALNESINTLKSQHQGADTINEYGFYILHHENYFAKAFEKLELNFVQINHSLQFQEVSKSRGYSEVLSFILTYCHQQNIKMTIVIMPTHARLLETYHAAGLWPRFEVWKTGITQTNEDVAKKTNRKPFALWDANIYNEFTMERIASDKRANWFFESSHIRPEYGAKLITSVLENKSGIFKNSILAKPLSLAMLESHLSEQRKTRIEYLKNNADQVSHIIERAELLDSLKTTDIKKAGI